MRYPLLANVLPKAKRKNPIVVKMRNQTQGDRTLVSAAMAKEATAKMNAMIASVVKMMVGNLLNMSFRESRPGTMLIVLIVYWQVIVLSMTTGENLGGVG